MLNTSHQISVSEDGIYISALQMCRRRWASPKWEHPCKELSEYGPNTRAWSLSKPMTRVRIFWSRSAPAIMVINFRLMGRDECWPTPSIRMKWVPTAVTSTSTTTNIGKRARLVWTKVSCEYQICQFFAEAKMYSCVPYRRRLWSSCNTWNWP